MTTNANIIRRDALRFIEIDCRRGAVTESVAKRASAYLTLSRVRSQPYDANTWAMHAMERFAMREAGSIRC